MKKQLTKEEISGIISKQISEGLKEIPKKSELKKSSKKTFKKSRKMLDKRERIWYYRQAIARLHSGKRKFADAD